MKTISHCKANYKMEKYILSIFFITWGKQKYQDINYTTVKTTLRILENMKGKN